ncbi:MAG: NAD(P)-dependent oxidoreductase [Bacteroidota bacterium]
MGKKILLTNKGIHPFLAKSLEKIGYECHFDYTSSKTEIEEKIAGYYGVVMKSRFRADKTFFKAAKNLAFLARVGVGFEHIDVKYAKKKGIEIILSPEGSREAVGEHTMGLLLCLLNNLHKGDREIRDGKWIREPNRGVEIKGKKVGIIGFGNMGKSFAKRLGGFGAKVMAYDKYKEDYGKKYAKEVSLKTIFKESDIVSLHIPYDEHNHYFVDKAFLKKFKKPIYLINTARGLVLNTKDVVRAMQKGKVLGVGLDVIEYEEQSFEAFKGKELPEPFQYLIQADNAVLSPHIAGWTMESKLKHAETIVQKIKQLEYKKAIS